MTDPIDEAQKHVDDELATIREAYAAAARAIAALGDAPSNRHRGVATMFMESAMLWLEKDLLALEKEAMRG